MTRRGARVSTLAIALPYASRWFPAATFDMREMLQLHTRGIAAVVAQAPGGGGHGTGAQAPGLHPDRRAVPAAAQLPLVLPLGHAASVRLIAWTSYEQVLEGIARHARRVPAACRGAEMKRNTP